jgi:hypothetical protein
MEDMSPGDKINICRRREISGNVTEQAPNKTNPAKNTLTVNFFCRKVRGKIFAGFGFDTYVSAKQKTDRS